MKVHKIDGVKNPSNFLTKVLGPLENLMEKRRVGVVPRSEVPKPLPDFQESGKTLI